MLATEKDKTAFAAMRQSSGLLFFSIKTGPDQRVGAREYWHSKTKAPAHYKDAEKIADHIKQNKEKTYLSTASSGMDGCVIGIGYAENQGEADYITCRKADQETDAYELAGLKLFMRAIDSVRNNSRGVNLVGHNVTFFDIIFLHQRMLCLGLGPLIDTGKAFYNWNVVCTGQMMSTDAKNIPSLKSLCRSLGVENSSSEINKPEVCSLWLSGQDEKIREHAIDDVEKTRQCYNILSGNIRAVQL